MTCREKLRLEHPARVNPRFDGGCEQCPHTYGYMPLSTSECMEMSCTECWDREIPGTETINKKEKESMATNTTKLTEMTREDMIEEIEIARKHIREMEAQIKNLEKYKAYEETADEIKAIHTALMDSGFSDDQAFDLLKTTMQSMMPTILRGMRV